MSQPGPQTLLVTGAYGFLGRHVCRTAARHGFLVTGLGRGEWDSPSRAAWGVSTWRQADVTTAALRQLELAPDVIVHCAGSGSAAPAMQDPQGDFTRSVISTVEVLEFIRTHSPESRLVFPSSGAVYGIPIHLPVSESDEIAPINPYGVHKRVAETMIMSYAQHFRVKAAIVRIFSLYGTELRKQLLWDACVKATSGNRTFIGTGSETRDWVAVEDAAALMLRAARHASPDAPIVNAATGIESTMYDVLAHLFASLGIRGQPEFTGERRAGDLVRYAGDPSRALAWGWVPQHAWPEGVAQYAGWFLECEREAM